tara:strand:- start:29 stop:406 length:378 start_codon:yes stop_codon:yes gene_type:complete
MMKENLNINQCVDGKEGELHQSVKLAPLGLVGSNPTPHTIKKGEKLMSHVAEIVVEQGNNDFMVDGWRVCSFIDDDVDGNTFTNYEVAYWRGGSIEWAASNGCLEYFRCIDRALDYFEDIVGGIA